MKAGDWPFKVMSGSFLSYCVSVVRRSLCIGLDLNLWSKTRQLKDEIAGHLPEIW